MLCILATRVQEKDYEEVTKGISNNPKKSQSFTDFVTKVMLQVIYNPPVIQVTSR